MSTILDLKRKKISKSVCVSHIMLQNVKVMTEEREGMIKSELLFRPSLF